MIIINKNSNKNKDNSVVYTTLEGLRERLPEVYSFSSPVNNLSTSQLDRQNQFLWTCMTGVKLDSGTVTVSDTLNPTEYPPLGITTYLVRDFSVDRKYKLC